MGLFDYRASACILTVVKVAVAVVDLVDQVEASVEVVLALVVTEVETVEVAMVIPRL